MSAAMKDFMDEKEIDNELELLDEDESFTEELEDIEENSAQKIKKLKQQLKECEKEKMEHLENLHRSKAEFLNGKRRLEEERIQEKERAVAVQIDKLLPLCDSFTMAISDKKGWATTDETWRKGFENIYNQLQSILVSYNVSAVNPEGEEFNPTIHDAMTTVPVHDANMHNKIISVVQSGYTRKVGDKEILIRPARVTIGEYVE